MSCVDERVPRGKQLREHTAHVRPAQAASVAGLGVAAMGAWSSLIAAPWALGAPIVVLAALLAGGWLSRSVAAAAFVAWIPGALVLAGVPVGALAPPAWPTLVGDIVTGAGQLSTPASRLGGIAWSVPAAVLASGVLWVTGSALAWPASPARLRRVASFGLVAAPWIVAAGISRGDHAGWQGAVVLGAGLLWFSRPRPAIAPAVVIALLSVPLAQAIGPRTPWIHVGQPAAGSGSFASLASNPTYGPLTDRRTGAPMLQIDAAQPALWRMQTLDFVDTGGWSVSPTRLPLLPQPAAQPTRASVRVIGLRNDLLVGPGRIQRVDAPRTASATDGEAWRVAGGLREGGKYKVRAYSVRVTGAQLERDRSPIGARARAYTHYGPSPGDIALSWALARLFFGPFVLGTGAFARSVPDPRVVALARRLAAGAHTEWAIVARVERYLLDDRRFRYTTRVPDPGPHPLVDFLLHTRAGYCQQFAGAAALLLRLDGVPARVVSGFATGVQTRPGRYVVRDLDAHQWIEVYFPGYGWVPFNPTPAADPATIARGLDPLASPALAARPPADLAVAVVLAALAVTGVRFVRRRSRRAPDRLQQLLERVARRTGARLEPASTLSQLGVALARLGPRTAELAAETERARFGPGVARPARRPRVQLARAMASDLGPVGALLAYAPVALPLCLLWRRRRHGVTRGQLGPVPTTSGRPRS